MDKKEVKLNKKRWIKNYSLISSKYPTQLKTKNAVFSIGLIIQQTLK